MSVRSPRALPVILACLIVSIGVSACSVGARAPATLSSSYPTPTVVDRRPTETPAFAEGGLQSGSSALAVSALMDQVQSDALIATIDKLVRFDTRHVLSKADPRTGIANARDWLIGEFDALKNRYPERQLGVFTQPFTYQWSDQTIQADNVILILPGQAVGAGVIVIGAHYDSISQPFTDGSAYAPGANDNGSGVAALLETARILANVPHQATILFVCFAAEETGRQGSIAFVNDYLRAQTPPVDVRAMLNLDMIGSPFGQDGQVDSSTLRLFSAEPNTSPSRVLGRQIDLIARTYLEAELRIALQSAEDRRGRWGDHMSFTSADYPAVRLIQSLEDPSRQHNGRDTLDGIQPGYVVKAAQLTVASASVLADGPNPPTAILISRADDSSKRLTLSWQSAPEISRTVIALRKRTSVAFDQILTTDGVSQITWDGLADFYGVSLASIDTNGLIGSLSAEVTIR